MARTLNTSLPCIPVEGRYAARIGAVHVDRVAARVAIDHQHVGHVVDVHRVGVITAVHGHRADHRVQVEYVVAVIAIEGRGAARAGAVDVDRVVLAWPFTNSRSVTSLISTYRCRRRY